MPTFNWDKIERDLSKQTGLWKSNECICEKCTLRYCDEFYDCPTPEIGCPEFTQDITRGLSFHSDFASAGRLLEWLHDKRYSVKLAYGECVIEKINPRGYWYAASINDEPMEALTLAAHEAICKEGKC